jgi:hypothetical protein
MHIAVKVILYMIFTTLAASIRTLPLKNLLANAAPSIAI